MGNSNNNEQIVDGVNFVTISMIQTAYLFRMFKHMGSVHRLAVCFFNK